MEKKSDNFWQYRFFGHPVVWYLHLIKRRVIYTWLAVLLVRFFTSVPLVDMRLMIFTGLFSYLAEMVSYVFLALALVRLTKVKRAEAALAAAIAGALVGWGVAIVEIFWYHNLWSLLQIIIHPLLSAFLASTVMMIIFIFKRNNNLKK